MPDSSRASRFETARSQWKSIGPSSEIAQRPPSFRHCCRWRMQPKCRTNDRNVNVAGVSRQWLGWRSAREIHRRGVRPAQQHRHPLVAARAIPAGCKGGERCSPAGLDDDARHVP